MSSPSASASASTGPSDLDAVGTLLGRTSRLARLLNRAGPRNLTRTESGLLDTLGGGQRTINELAETEALTQPAVSKLVDRLERRELVARRRADHDALEEKTEHIRGVLREALSELSDSDIATLIATGDVFERFIERLQSKVTGR
jgi:DNA-binding MarR family transcriptional regulator